jgi:hypothetical protein
MARIQITDLNSSDSELIDEFTAEELLAINGGGKIGTVLRALATICDVFNW